MMDITKMSNATPKINPMTAIKEIKDNSLFGLSDLKYLHPMRKG
jgi:hypothetical protein